MTEFRKTDKEDEPAIEATSLTAQEMSMAAVLIDAARISRDGYTFDCRGSCAKFPQGLWFDIRIEFEETADRDAIFEMFGAHDAWPDGVRQQAPQVSA